MPSVELDIVSPLPKAISSPVTVKSPATATFAPLKVIAVALLDLISLPPTFKSPLNSVNVDVTVTLPLEGFVI